MVRETVARARETVYREIVNSTDENNKSFDIILTYDKETETFWYYTDILNKYHANSEEYYANILNQCQLDTEKYYTEYNKNIADYCIWYEKELNEYYTECLRNLCWEYYTNVENNQVKLNHELVIKNRDLLARNKTLQEFETKYNSLLTQNINYSLLTNSMKNEYNDIYRRLLIMISQYNKLYIDFEKYKKPGVVVDVDIPEKINEINEIHDIDNIDKIQEIPDDYDYVDVEQFDNSNV